MKKIKVAEATNAQLDWLVARCEVPMSLNCLAVVDGRPFVTPRGKYHLPRWANYVTDWSQMGPIIEREGMGLWQYQWDSAGEPNPGWYAEDKDGNHVRVSPTPLIAAARCYITSKLGETVEVPEELS